MNWISVGVVIGALACATISGVAQSASSTTYDPSVGPAIHIEDVDRFYKVYDAAGGHPTAEQLQYDYVDLGSDGLHEFAKLRNISGERIADTLVSHPEIYSSAKRCMLVLPRVRRRLEVALRTLGRLYPEARFPPVTIAVFVAAWAMKVSFKSNTQNELDDSDPRASQPGSSTERKWELSR